ncbi:MAG: HEAT repeat domain-containing protein, partial [Candidatus Kapabacteria bacterium]|nr:HEAT repeat domain-containing protein [Candidatus Kapabacteria bacterium]
ECVQTLIVATLDSSWKRRRLAAYTLGEIGDSTSRSALMNLLRDPHSYVRQRSAFALGRMGVGFDSLRSTLQDEDQIARYGAVEGMARGPRRSMSSITTWLRSVTDPYALVSGLRLFGIADTTVADVKAYSSWYASSPAWVREATRRAAPHLATFWRTMILNPAASTTKKSKKKS